MTIPVLYKDIEVNERNFRLNKMDARTGSYMLFKMVKILAPIVKNVDMKSLENFDIDSLNLTDLLSSIFDLPEDEFRYIQDNCLKTVKEMLPIGLTDVIDKDGNFGVSDIEFDVALLMNLTVQSLMFNVSGFFEGNLLSSTLKGLNLSQQSSKM